jgi:hypothetical protein
VNEILPKEKGFQSSKDPLVDSSSFYCSLHTGRSGIPLFPRFLDPFLVVNIASNTLFYLGWINKTLSFIATMAKTNKPPLKKAMVGKIVLTNPKENRKVSAAVSSLLAETSPLVSTPSTVSSRSSMDFFSASSPSSLFAVSKSPLTYDSN